MELIKFLTFINLKLKYKKKKFKYRYIHKLIKIMNLFVRINLIKSFFIKDNYFIIELIHYDNHFIYNNLKILYKIKQKKTVHYKYFLKKNVNFNSSLLILSTTKGFITNYEAVKYKIGGVLICRILN